MVPVKFQEKRYFHCMPISKSHQTDLLLSLIVNTAELKIFLKVFFFLLPGNALPNNWHLQQLSSFFLRLFPLRNRDWIVQNCQNWSFLIQNKPFALYTHLSTWHLPILFQPAGTHSMMCWFSGISFLSSLKYSPTGWFKSPLWFVNFTSPVKASTMILHFYKKSSKWLQAGVKWAMKMFLLLMYNCFWHASKAGKPFHHNYDCITKLGNYGEGEQ